MLKKFTFLIISALLAHIIIFAFLVSSPLGNKIFNDSFIYALLLITIAFAAFYIFFNSYKVCQKDSSSKIPLLFLAFYVLGITFLLRALSGSDFNLFPNHRFIFSIAWEYGLFLSSLFLFGLAIPFSSGKKYICLYKFKLFLAFNIFNIFCFFSLFYFSSLAPKLIEAANFFKGINGALLFVLIIFLLQQYRETKNKFLPSLIFGLALLLNSLVITFFGKEWNLIWWYAHIIILFGFLIIAISVEKIRRQEKGLDEAFNDFSIYSKISTKLVISFLLVTILSIFITGYASFSTAKDNLKTQILDSLELLTQTKKNQLIDFLESLKIRTINLAKDDFLSNNLEQYLALSNQSDNQEFSQEKAKILGDLNYYLSQSQLIYSSIIYRINIITPEGKIIASTNPDEIGQKNKGGNYLISALNYNYGQAYSSDIFITQDKEKKPSLATASPIVDKKNKKIALIVTYTSADTLKNIISGRQSNISENIGKGAGVEIYLVNHNNLLITETSFSKTGILKQKILTEPIIRCKYGDEINQIYTDYQNVSVVGSSACLGNGWTLVVETGEVEVFTGLEIIKIKIVLTSMFVLAFVLVLVYFLVKKITDPIESLTNTAQKISSGNLKVRASTETKGEIGLLAASFNQMTESLIKASDNLKKQYQKLQITSEELQEAKENLEKKVKERTRELQEKLLEVERFNRIAVGRELRMVELKEEIKKLKNPKKIKQTK